MAVVDTQWQNANELRSYPLHDLATLTDVDGKVLPNDVVVGASIWLPKAYGTAVYISSVAITPGIVTLTFLAGSHPFDEPSSSDGAQSFTPLAVLSVVKPITRFRNYALSALVPGVGGWVALGAAAAERGDLSLRFDGAEASALLDRCVRAYDQLPVTALGKEGSAAALTGLITLAGRAGATRTFKSTRVIEGVERDVAAIGLDTTEDAVARLQDFAGTCGHKPAAGNCNKDPIESIEGVGPDEDGNIDIEFLGEEVIGDVREGIVIDYPIGIGDVEPKLGSSLDGPPIVSSEAGPPESSEPGPDEPEGSSVSGDEYCEDFEDGAADELVVRVGDFEIVEDERTKRYISSSGVPTSQLAVNPNRDLDAADVYTVRSRIRPLNADGNGFLVFGYDNINSFMVAGVTLRGQEPSYPDGRFFIGHKVVTVVNWPNGLGDGLTFDISYAPPAALIETDYDIFLEVENFGVGVNVARLYANWNDGSARSISQVYVLPSVFNQIGWGGLGVVGARTEFDRFGINCGGFSSSSSSSSSGP